MQIVVEKCQVCKGKSGKVAHHYEGYHAWLCNECFFELSHEKLLELREKYYEKQGIIANT